MDTKLLTWTKKRVNEYLYVILCVPHRANLYSIQIRLRYYFLRLVLRNT